ncbi:MAG: DMT family transporter [Beijerinckiaceae bacterium]|jgi:drug/metabolite transporter (DMT)-like permease|nr:DMT family transporter [Beijerinckiaceae bacterium]
MSALEWAMLLALSVLWGGSFFFIGVAVKELPTLTIVVVRVVLASLFLLAVLRASGTVIPMSTPVWLAFFGMGFLNNVVPFTLIVWGQGHIASGVASILNATTPLFTVIVAHVLTSDEKMTGNRLLGVAVGLAGVSIMIGTEVLQSLGVGIVAQLACLAAAVSYAFAGVFGRRFRAMGVSPMATAWGQVTASSLILLPLMLTIDKPWLLPVPSAQAIAAMIALAALSTALAYVLFFRVLASAGATNIALVTFLIPVSAILLGILFLNEALQARHIVGMAMIGLGLAAIDGRLWKRLRAAV